jgi:hypothetical protein
MPNRNKAVKEAIFQLVHKGWSGDSKEHPDYLAIEKIVGALPEGMEDEFYSYLVTRNFGNEAGFYSIKDVATALNYFRIEAAERYFEEHGASKFISSLYVKLTKLLETMRKRENTISISEQAERMDLKQIRFVNGEGEKVPLFTTEEMEILGNDFAWFVHVLYSEGNGRLKEEIEEAVRRWITREKLSFGPPPVLAIEGSKKRGIQLLNGKKSEGGERVISLLESMKKRGESH